MCCIDVVTQLEEFQLGICYDLIVETQNKIDLNLLQRQNANGVRKFVEVLTRSGGTEGHSAVDPSVARQIILNSIHSDICWRNIDNAAEFSNYCVVSCNTPHVLLKANHRWYSEFGYHQSDVGKVDILELLTDAVGPKTCLQSMRHDDLLKLFSNDLHQNVASHIILELQNKKTGYVGLYSIHYYPILCKRDPDDEEDKEEYEQLK